MPNLWSRKFWRENSKFNFLDQVFASLLKNIGSHPGVADDPTDGRTFCSSQAELYAYAKKEFGNAAAAAPTFPSRSLPSFSWRCSFAAAPVIAVTFGVSSPLFHDSRLPTAIGETSLYNIKTSCIFSSACDCFADNTHFVKKITLLDLNEELIFFFNLSVNCVKKSAKKN